MLPDLSEIESESLAALEAGRRLGIVARAGKALPRFGSASVEMSDAFGGAVPYLLEVFQDEIRSWVRVEGLEWLDWIVVPRQHRTLCVFGVYDEAEPERPIEYVIEYEIDRCVTSGDWSVDGGLMARVDGRAMDALGRKAVSA